MQNDSHYINQQMHLMKYNHDDYQTPTCFSTEVSSSGSLLEQRNKVEQLI